MAVLKRAGAQRIVAVDMHARPLEIARAVGADEVLKGDDAEAIAAVEADVVIESSGSHHGLASAIKGAARGGKVVMVGLLPSGPQPVPISLAITRELELLGSFRFNDEIDEVDCRPRGRIAVCGSGGHPHLHAGRGTGGFRGCQELSRFRQGAPGLQASPGGVGAAGSTTVSGAAPGQTPWAGPSMSGPAPRWTRA